MNFAIDGLLKNLKNKKLNYNIDLVLEGGCMNGAYEIGGLLLLKGLEKEKKITIDRISGASVGAFVGLLYITNKLECYTKHYQKWRTAFNETVKLEHLKDLIIEICSGITDEDFKSLQKNKLFITYYDVKTRRCILIKEYKTREELWNAILKSCHVPYLINGEIFYRTEEGEYLDGGLPYIFKLQSYKPKHRVLYMKLTQTNRLKTIFNVADEENMDGRILGGLIDTYNFLMHEGKTEMCSFVNNWGFIDLLRYNCMDYIYWFGVSLLILSYKVIKYIAPTLEQTNIYKRLKPMGQNIFKEIIRYMVFT